LSTLLERAFAETRCLPPDEQDYIATLILEQLAEDRKWDEAFEKHPGKLDAIEKQAREDIAAGLLIPGGWSQQ
jgi:hypothetical protein